MLARQRRGRGAAGARQGRECVALLHAGYRPPTMFTFQRERSGLNRAPYVLQLKWSIREALRVTRSYRSE